MTTLKYGWKLFVEQCCSKKCGVVVILLYFVNHLFLSGIKDFCCAVNCNITPYLFPFLISYVYYQLIYTMIVLYYFSNVPFQGYSQMYQLIRLGNTRWALGHIFYIIFSSIFLVLITIGEGIIIMLPRVEVSADWGKVLHTLAVSNVVDSYGLYAIPYDNIFMNHYNAILGMEIAFVMSVCVTVFLGTLLFLTSLYWGRIVALFIASIEIALPIVSLNLEYRIMYKVNLFAPVSWMNLVDYERERMGFRIMPNMNYTFFMLFAVILCFVGLIIYKTKRIEFHFMKEE